MNMKVYKTTHNLKQNQYAYLIKLDKIKHKHDYLCIDTNVKSNSLYKIGEVVNNIPDDELEAVDYDIKESPIYNTFLFQYFIDKYSNRNVRDILPQMTRVSNNSNLTHDVAYSLSRQLDLRTHKDFKLWLNIVERSIQKSTRFFR